MDTDHFGSSEFMYVEDSRFSGGYLGDCSNGGRYVIRYSTILGDNQGMANHGTHDRWRGCRAAEFYQDSFTANSGSSGGAQHLNSGPLLMWGNTVTGFYNIVDISIVRQTGANGPPTYPQSYPPSGFGYCGTRDRQSNGLLEDSPWDGNQNTSSGYPCLDQPGRGSGDLLRGYPESNAINQRTGSQVWPNEVLSPIYVWGNTLNTPGNGIIGDNTLGTLSDNRDYYQQFGAFGESGSFNGTKGVGQGLLSGRPSTCTAGPGGNTPGVGYWATDTNTLYVCNPTNTWTVYYTPYTYPHPLASSGGTAPDPPTNVSVIVQ